MDRPKVEPKPTRIKPNFIAQYSALMRFHYKIDPYADSLSDQDWAQIAGEMMWVLDFQKGGTDA